MKELANLSDGDLADEVQKREVAYQDAMGELLRRRDAKDIPEWSEADMNALLALFREDRQNLASFRFNTDSPQPSLI